MNPEYQPDVLTEIIIDLEDLESVSQCTPSGLASHMCECGIVSLNLHNHKSDVQMPTTALGHEHLIPIRWDRGITQEMLNGYRDETKRIDHAACGIALSLVSQPTEYVAIEQSRKGDRMDYRLTSRANGDKLIFNASRGLEVSGINSERGSNTVRNRIAEKRRRLDAPGGPGSGSGTTYVCVVEFATPKATLILL